MFQFEEEFEGKKVESLNNFYATLKKKESSCTAVAENLSDYLFYSVPLEDIKSHFVNSGGGKSLSLLLSLCGNYNFMSQTGICLSNDEKKTLKNNIDIFLEKPKWKTNDESQTDYFNNWMYIILVQKYLNK